MLRWGWHGGHGVILQHHCEVCILVIWISALVIAAALGTGWGIQLRRRRPVRQRRVEQPNSYYAAPGVRRLVDLERWGRIPLDQLHPLNRDEVRRLLRLARAGGADSLAPRERCFLDNIASCTGRPAPDARVPASAMWLGDHAGGA